MTMPSNNGIGGVFRHNLSKSAGALVWCLECYMRDRCGLSGAREDHGK